MWYNYVGAVFSTDHSKALAPVELNWNMDIMF